MASTQNLYQCRLCLKRTPTRVNIFGGDFPKMLEILTSIKVRENDGLPRYCCLKCALDVKSALIIRKRIIKTHKYLLANLGKQSIPSTSNQRVESFKKAVLKRTKSAKPDSKAPATKCPTDEATSNSQNLENPSEYITAKIQIKEEVVDDIQDSNDASIADEESGSGSTSEVRDKVQVHRKAIREPITYTCEECNLSFNKRLAYKIHNGKHKKTKCDICNKLIRSENFKKHLIVHSSSGPSVCNSCGATYKNCESLRNHIYRKHRNPTRCVCDECGATSRNRYDLNLHKASVHTGERNFKCETCGKAFLTKARLVRHDRSRHQKQRPYVCDICGTGVTSRLALETHKRRHTNEKPFICDQCNEGFRQKVSLRSHLKSKHGVEEAIGSICSDCGRGFATNYALRIHQRLHASTKCEVCSEPFFGQEYLDNHLKEAHGIDNEVKEDESQGSEENDEDSQIEKE